MLYLDRKGWTVFTVEERYWFARLLLECFFWNNFADDDTTRTKYATREETRELPTSIFGRYSLAIREAIWWKILLCACYESVKGETAVIESGTGAIIDIIRELLFTEIELAEDLLEEDRDFALWYFTRYRILVESISRSLMKRWDEDEEEQLSSEPPTPQEMLKSTSISYWKDRLDDLEILFTAYDADYTFGANLPREAMDFLTIDPKYYDEKTILGELQKNQEYGYWDLLCLCLEKKPLPPLSEVKKQPKESNWFLSLEKHLSDERLKMLESLVITNCFVLSK